MNELVAYGIVAVSLGVAVFATWHVVRGEPLGNPLFYAVSVLEIVLIALLIGSSIALANTAREVDGALFVSYLVTVVVIPPAAVLWGIADKSRWGTGVVLVALLTVAVLIIRLLGIWQGRYV